MSAINSVGPTTPINKLQAPAAPAKPADPADQTLFRDRDSVELSGVQAFLQTLKTNDIRAEKVAEIKSQIAADTYESEEKFDIAADKLLDDVL